MKQQRWGNNTREDDSQSGCSKILLAAKHCYERCGIAATTLDDIAGEAKITRRTIYRYFDNKKAIIQAVVDEQARDFLYRLRDEIYDPAFDFSTQLQHYIVYLVEYGQQAPGHQLLLGRDNVAASMEFYLASRENYKILESLIRQPFEDAQACGEIRRDISYSQLMAWVGRVVFSYIQMPAPATTVAEQVLGFVIPALRPVDDVIARRTKNVEDMSP